MTLAEQWIEEGREEGIEEGIEQGIEQERIATISKLLKFKF